MLKSIALCVTVLSLAVLPATLTAQNEAKTTVTVKMKEEKPGLLAQAKVKAADARKSAQAKAPGERLVSQEIEHENGKLVYSFDFKAEGKGGVDEVNVDALTGEVVGIEHESKADEAAEKTGHALKTGAKKTGHAVKTAADTVKNRF